LGAFTSFSAAAFKHKPAIAGESRQVAPLVQIGLSGSPSTREQIRLELQYVRTLVLGGESSVHPFRESLSGIAAGPADRIFVLGDGELRVFEPDGKMVRSYKAPEGALCIAIDSEERTYFGLEGRVEIYGSNGVRTGGFSAGENGNPAIITAIKVSGQEVLAADVAAKLVRRYDLSGKQLGTVGTQAKVRGFMLPNKSLDIAVDANGVIHAADPGRHRVSSWKSDGSMIGRFGKFGLIHPEDFVGCCNPVNLAILPNGNFVTAEKVAARVKVYSREGKLLALIGPEYFDSKCIHLFLAADSRGRILVADPIRKKIQIFSISNRSGDDKSI
jgi:hypothetical protein